jgi:hypothetical protein
MPSCRTHEIHVTLLKHSRTAGKAAHTIFDFLDCPALHAGVKRLNLIEVALYLHPENVVGQTEQNILGHQ